MGTLPLGVAVHAGAAKHARRVAPLKMLTVPFALLVIALYAAAASRSVPREEPWRSIRFQHDVL
jgi:hypothetical protein